MYPTINSFESFNLSSSSQQPQSQVTSRRGVSATVPQGGSANGPSNARNPTTTTQFPVLRVKIAESYQIPPPDAITTSVNDTSSIPINLNLALERQILAGVWEPRRRVSGTEDLNGQEPVFTNAMQKYQTMGYDKEEVALALATYGLDDQQQDKVVDFCKNYRQLTSMGFPASYVVGALIMSNNDVTLATDACLAACA